MSLLSKKGAETSFYPLRAAKGKRSLTPLLSIGIFKFLYDKKVV